eukprot:6207738-Pleurochrysis_carterae.AAC.2
MSLPWAKGSTPRWRRSDKMQKRSCTPCRCSSLCHWPVEKAPPDGEQIAVESFGALGVLLLIAPIEEDADGVASASDADAAGATSSLGEITGSISVEVQPDVLFRKELTACELALPGAFVQTLSSKDGCSALADLGAVVSRSCASKTGAAEASMGGAARRRQKLEKTFGRLRLPLLRQVPGKLLLLNKWPSRREALNRERLWFHEAVVGLEAAQIEHAILSQVH